MFISNNNYAKFSNFVFAETVGVDFFNSWPSKNKKLFQFSLDKSKRKNVETISIFKNRPFFKLIGLPIMIFRIIKYFTVWYIIYVA